MKLTKQRGRVHVLGHDVPHDGGVMAFDIVLSRVTDPIHLVPHLFAEIDPGLQARIQRVNLGRQGGDLTTQRPQRLAEQPGVARPRAEAPHP